MNERETKKTGQPEPNEDELDWDSPDEQAPRAEPAATRPKRDSFIPLPQGFRQRRRDSESSGLDWNAKPPVRESSPPLRPPSRPPVGRDAPVAKPAAPAKPVALPRPAIAKPIAARPAEVVKPAAKAAEVAKAPLEGRGQVGAKAAASFPAEGPAAPAKAERADAVAKPAAPRVIKAVDAPRASEAVKVSGEKIQPLEARAIREVGAVEAAPKPAPVPKAGEQNVAVEARPIVTPRTLTPVLGLAPARQPQLIYSQAGNPTPEMPIVYRERAYFVDSLLGDDELKDSLLRELGSLKEELRSWQQVKYVQLALFDHKFQRQPTAPPLATLSWKDWQSEPEIWVRGVRRSGPPPAAEPGDSRPDWDLHLDAYGGPSTERGVAAKQQLTPEPAPVTPEPTEAMPVDEAPLDEAPASAEVSAANEIAAEPGDEVPAATEASAAEPGDAAPVDEEPSASAPVDAAPGLEEEDIAAEPVEPEPITAEPVIAQPLARRRSSPVPQRRSLPPRPKTERPGSSAPIELSITDAPFSDEELPDGSLEGRRSSPPRRSAPPRRSSLPSSRRTPSPSAKPPARRSRAPREPQPIELEPESLEPEALEEERRLDEADARDDASAEAHDEALADSLEARVNDDAVLRDVSNEPEDPAPLEGTPQLGFPAPTASDEPDAEHYVPDSSDETTPMPLVRRRTMPAPGNDVLDELETFEQPETLDDLVRAPTPTPISGVDEEPIPLVSIRPSRAPAPAEVLAAVDQSAEDDELLGALFERMHELMYAPSITAGADFVLAVLAETMPCEAVIVHVFDRNDRSFLVVRARGPNSERIVLSRTPETDARLALMLRRVRSTPSIPPDANATRPDAAPSPTLWQRLGVSAQHTLAGPAVHERGFVGLIELANPERGGPFSERESVALDYVLEQFADFVVKKADD